MASKTKKNPSVESISLSELSSRFITHLERSGKSAGTSFSYLMELKCAQNFLGADTLLNALSADAIAEFNASERVTTLKSGKPKSQLSIDKTRRVLRQALTFAHASGWLAEPIVDAKKDALPNADESVVAASEPVEAPKKKRSRKQAITLEVAQPEAEAVADEVEAQLDA